MKKKIRNYCLAALFIISGIMFTSSFVFMSKSVKAHVTNERAIIENDDYFNDIQDGEVGTCIRGSETNARVLDSKSYCIENCKTHGPGRETGGIELLNIGCRNYMFSGFNYGATNIPYWIDMSSIEGIVNLAHRQKVLSDIREQTEMWNKAEMHDGTGQIVNIYEVNQYQSKPSSINGRQVIEVTNRDLTAMGAAGVFNCNNFSVALNYNNGIGYNADTVVHEFGHVLGLDDIDSANKVSNGTHKTLMGYSRDITTATLYKTIKYSDIQGIAVTTGRHSCQSSHFMRYVKEGSNYKYICFYCDRIDNRTSIISDSNAMVSANYCMHDYRAMVSYGKTVWMKCTKCYKVIQQYFECTISFSDNGVLSSRTAKVLPNDPVPEINMFAPEKAGYAFDGYYDLRGVKYYEMKVVDDRQTADIYGYRHAYVEKAVPVAGKIWDHLEDKTLYARWTLLEADYTYNNVCNGKIISSSVAHLKTGRNAITPASIGNYKFSHFMYGGQRFTSEVDLVLYRTYGNNIYPRDNVITAYYDEDGSCLAAGSLITLADGRQVAVENLTGEEMLLVWDLYTGTYDIAPVLFIDSDPSRLYKVINLLFSDGTSVKVISEHGFWDCDLNRYVYLDENAERYIGHLFKKGDSSVRLTGVEIKEEYTTAWSPVTYGQLCYYVNGMLSMPGGIDGLFNIFEVDAAAMKYDSVSMQADIAQYGLFTYEEFTEHFYLPREVFEAFNGRYLKIAIGKGLITIDGLRLLYARYGEFFA